MTTLIVLFGTALIFSVLALHYTRILGLHLLFTWVFLLGLPLFSIGAEAVSARPLAGEAVGRALVQHMPLYFLYILGVAAVLLVARDAVVLSRLRSALATLTLKRPWLLLFVACFASDFIARVAFDILISGTGTTVNLTRIPYVYSSLLSVVSTLAYGLFCYLSVVSRRNRAVFCLCLLYSMYLLIVDGRRGLILSLVALLFLRSLSVKLVLNQRLIVIGIASAFAFLLIGPVFMEARIHAQNLQAGGLDPLAALSRGISDAYRAISTGEVSIFELLANNLGSRPNAGVFLLAVAEFHPALAGGRYTAASVQWAIPSIFGDKPVLPVEQLIQSGAGLPLFDDSISVPAVFIADFGYIGIFLAGLLSAVTLYLLAKGVGRSRNFGLVQASMLGVFFEFSTQIENDLTFQIVELRNLGLIALVVLTSAGMRHAINVRTNSLRDARIGTTLLCEATVLQRTRLAFSRPASDT